MTNCIELKNVSFGYDDLSNSVIDNVSFNIQQGSYTVILGCNGSGKSTLAKLIMGLLEVKSGNIFVNNMLLNEQNIYHIRKKIGIVFQNPDNQFIGATVRDDIAFGLENRCIDPSKMEEIILEYSTKVGMNQFLDHEPSKLSGGQKQRVAIAGILAMSPDIIILDEATSMLDPNGKDDILELIRHINKETNCTIISISHDIEEAVYADDIILLNNGRVIKQGRPDELLTNEDLLFELKLEEPFAYKLSKKLAEKGIGIGITLKKEELINELCQLNSKM